VRSISASGLLRRASGWQGHNDAKIVSAIEAGELDKAVLDQAVERLLGLILHAADVLSAEAPYDREAHHALAREAAAEGAVLLKNEDGILPLRETDSIALLGAFAKAPRYQGAGSSQVTPHRLDNLYDEFLKLAPEGQEVRYADGYFLDSDRVDESLLAEACAVASQAEIAVVCVGDMRDSFLGRMLYKEPFDIRWSSPPTAKTPCL
jgi:beta-glucosidase